MITLINHQGLKIVKGIQIQTPAPPIGLAYIGAYLKQNGYSYTAIDACGEALNQILPYENNAQMMIQGLTLAQIIERIPGNSKIIGFTCSFSHCWPLVVRIAEAVRKIIPDAILVVGGEHPTVMPAHALKNGIFDAVVLGEGEETFIELVHKIKENGDWYEIDGIAYINKEQEVVINKRRMRVKDINSFPYPDWESWCIEKYIEHQQVSGINLGRSIPILGSRGCPYSCKFCSNERMWTRNYIMRSGKLLVDEMEYMKNKYNLSGFAFFDSTFIINRKKTYDFCEELIRRKLDVTYQLPAGTRCEVFDDELAVVLEKSGLRNFSFAPESGSDMVRKVINKQIKIDDFFRAVKSVKKTKMTVGVFIVIGFPEDNNTTMKQNLSLARKLSFMGVDDITVSQFTPYPGSVYFDDLLRKKHLSDQLEELNDVISFFSKDKVSYCNSLTSEQIYHWMTLMYINFYIISFVIRPWKLLINFWDYFSKGIENTRYMRFFSEIFFKRRKWKYVKP